MVKRGGAGAHPAHRRRSRDEYCFCFLLGNLAVLSLQKIEWDAKKMKAKGSTQAVEDLIRPPMRKGWTL